MTRKVTLLFLAVLALGTLQACGGGSGGGTPTSVTVSPKLAEVAAGVQSQSFTATISGGGASTGVTWSVDGVQGGNSTVGAISALGVYAAPATAGTHTITATAVADTSKSDTATVAVTDLAGVFTYHNNLSRDGSNTQEYLLSGTTVTQATFGKLFSCPVDGAVYTQPLWVPGVSINGALHNVIYVATQHDSVYAFDADANPCVKLWKASLLDGMHGATGGEGPVPCDETVFCAVGAGFGDIQPEIGITGTPVIDPATNTLYVVSKSCSACNGASPLFYQRLHALDLATGMAEKFNGPVLIAAQVPGVGDGGTTVSFSARMEHQRSGLALANGTIFVSWAAHEDAPPYHGWLMGFNASNLAQSPSVFNTTPNGGLGGIWAGGGAPAIDAVGDVYVSTGNGIFDANSTTTPFNDFGDSILRLTGTGLALAGWFTPNNQDVISNWDADVGSGAVILLPGQTTGPPHLLAQIGKGEPPPVNSAVLFLIDRDNLGGFNTPDQTVQSLAVPGGGLWGTPAFWQNNLYIGGAGDSVRHFSFDTSTGLFNTAVVSSSTTIYDFPGTTPSVSSQQATSGIVWTIDASQYGPPAPGPGPAVIHAYSATNLAKEYWNSAQAPSSRDQAGSAVKFVPPTIANGKVYVSTRTEVDVYGVLQ